MTSNLDSEQREIIQNLKSKLHVIIRKFRDVYIHKEKLIPLFTGLKLLYQALSDENIEKHQKEFPAINKSTFRELNNTLISFDNFISQLSASEYYTYLSTNPPNRALTDILQFCQDFNDIASNFPLETNVLIAFDQVSFEKLNEIDIEAIINRLSELEQKSVVRNLISSFRHSTTQLPKIDKDDDFITFSDIESYLANFITFHLNNDDFEVHKKIGSNEYCEVFCASQKSTGRIVAMMKFLSTKFSNLTFSILKSEIRTLSILNHPSLLGFYGFGTDNYYAIYREHMPNGNLSELLRNNSNLNTTQLTIIILGISFGLQYLHNNHIIHQNLSSETIYLDSDFYPHIAEIGSGDSNDSIFVSEKDNISAYGRILWEIITYGSGPEHREKSSLVIPSIATIKLCKIIRSCQESNPNLRPSLNDILKNRKELYLNDVDENVVEAYVFRITNPNEEERPRSTRPKEFNMVNLLESASTNDKDTINSLITLNEIAIDDRLKVSLTIEQNLRKIVEIVTNCESAQKTAQIINLLASLFKEKETARKLCDYGVVPPLMNIFMRFGNTTTPSILVCLKVIIETTEIQFTKRNFEKLSAFLTFGNIQVRTSMMELLLDIVERKAYVNEDVISTFIPKIIENIIPEMPYTMLKISIKLLSKLMNIEKIFERICRFDGPTAVLQIATVKYPDIVTESINFLTKALQKWIVSLKFISKFTRSFGDIIAATSEEDIMKVFQLMDVVMKHDAAYSEIGDQPNSISAFEDLITSRNIEIRVKSLQIVFQFLKSKVSCDEFVPLLQTFFLIISEFKDETTSYISMQCIVLIGGNPNADLSLMSNAKIFDFISYSFYSNSIRLQEASLRMIGLMASRKECINFVVACGFIPRILNFVHNENLLLKELSYMCLATFTKSSQAIDLMDEIVQAVLSESITPQVIQFVLMIVMNAAIWPQCSVLIVGKLPLIMKMTDTSKYSYLLVIIEMLLNSREARNVMEQECCQMVLRLVKETRTSEMELQSATIFELLTLVKTAKPVIKEEVSYYEEAVKTMDVSSPLRPIYLRISTRKL